MCGIVGYTGHRQALPVLTKGLYTLEYRGYDSAGVAVETPEGLRVVKTKGRMKTLDEKIEAAGGLQGTCGIGHTRWATHGAPSDVNAHPHLSQDGRFAVVHNGIVENYLELRQELQKDGFVFKSETDTETIAHLFQKLYCGDMVKTLSAVVRRLHGGYALSIVSVDNPGEMVCVRQDNPLIVGFGEGENMIASDIPAILPITRRYAIPNDQEIVHVTPQGIHFYDLDGREIAHEPLTADWDVAAAEKGGYDHFMLKEIFEQPRAVRDTVSSRIKDGLPALDEYGLTDELFQSVQNIHVVACGSALHAGLVGKAVIEKLARVPVLTQVASEFRYSDPIIGPGDLCIIISQSGETADTLAALREAKKRGARTVAICNVVSSSAAREADSVLYTWAGPEIAVATTKAYSAQLAALYLIAVRAALARGTMDEASARAFCSEILALPGKIESLLGTRDEMDRLAKLYCDRNDTFFIGRGVDYAAAQEASLKLKEISYVHSEAYAGGELKHGTISLIEQGTLVVSLATDPALYEKIVSNIQSVKARGASVVLVTNGDYQSGGDVCDHVVHLPDCPAELAASLSIVPLQLLAYYIGVHRGCDIDKPRNLAKSVTVE